MLRRSTRVPLRAAAAVAVALLAGAAAGCGSSNGKDVAATTTPRSGSASSLAPISGHYSPSIDPASFVRKVDNRFWPLTPGTGFHFRGTRGSVAQVDDEVVTGQTKRILGIDATVVRDTVSQGGRPLERTLDFYAQDKQGNVWYMGEDSFELQHGRFAKASDSWRAGVDGAKAGIIMPARPHAGDAYRQEYYPAGEALDQARVLGYRGPVKVPYGTFRRALVTSEFSPVEPQTEEKLYVAGVGEVAEHVVKGHHEAFQLVSITH